MFFTKYCSQSNSSRFYTISSHCSPQCHSRRVRERIVSSNSNATQPIIHTGTDHFPEYKSCQLSPPYCSFQVHHHHPLFAYSSQYNKKSSWFMLMMMMMILANLKPTIPPCMVRKNLIKQQQQPVSFPITRQVSLYK